MEIEIKYNYEHDWIKYILELYKYTQSVVREMENNMRVANK